VKLITPAMTMDYLKKLIDDGETRSYTNLGESEKAEHFLKKEFESLGIHTCLHSFDNGGGTLTNVVAHIPGKVADSIVVGAHYDSRPFDGPAPGAEDNGSGVASLLAMAKAFMAGKGKTVPQRSVFFVAFAGEEPGLVGSAHFAQALKDDALPSECAAKSEASLIESQPKMRIERSIVKHSAVGTEASKHRAIIMDEVGWVTPKFSKHTVNLESLDGLGTEVMNHLRHASDMHNGDDIAVVHNGHPFGSDHMSFLNLGMGASLTINGDDEAYPHYHQSSDTIDNVNGELVAKITKMNLGALLRMCMA